MPKKMPEMSSETKSMIVGMFEGEKCRQRLLQSLELITPPYISFLNDLKEQEA